MLRVRLFYGLLTLVVLLWAVGATALLLMRDASKNYERRLEKNYNAISTAQGIRTITSTINSRYLPVLAGPPRAEGPERTSYDTIYSELDSRLATLKEEASHESNWDDAITRLENSIQAYSDGYEKYFGGGVTERDERELLLVFIANQTQQLTSNADTIVSLAEEKLFSGTRQLREESRKDVYFVTTLVLLGTTIAILIYSQLVHHMVDPIVGLKHSIEEVRNGNFELSLPTPTPGSEFGSVVSAFNDMAHELRIHRGETDEHIKRASLVNRAILEAIPSPLFVLGDDGRILQINPSAERLTESLGVSGRLPLKIQKIMDRCKEEGSHFLPEDPREALLFRINEEEFFYLPRIFRFISEDQTRSGWAVLLHNVSRIRWLDDMKTNLLSTVSHEIKTPLTGIRMVLHLLLEEKSLKLDPMQHTMVTSANEDCERLLVTLNTLLDLSRAESGTTYLARVPVQLAESLNRAARLYKSAASAKDIVIDVELPELELPEAYADPLRLDEVLNNLISNAIKHSPSGSTITLRLSKPEAEFLRVSVIDQGDGVPEEFQGRIFERFFRASDESIDGVGLGLFISREIIRAHEGRIGLLDRTNDETVFYIDVPIA
ncbi:HAMP domain-containing protein [Luteolibacter pohnpeiensis]|uniref:histidine kinase n=1 Tax=Luteolibacter pohnpeiensis TaxID=454153 RepID=A0A934S5I2_9BACT|nr:ATP-binding protein [Luteolibacter pohnpeiensis]MBK1883480.1 HAMP domain-containing protein [Luteolibacter pohnpeiensis]